MHPELGDLQDGSRDIPGEVAGNIHRSDFDGFWNDSQKPDVWTARVRKEGYRLSFKDDAWPAQYWEKNNKSALDSKDFTWDQLMDWERKGVVSRSASKPHCVSPLSVAARAVSDEIKKQPVSRS